MRGKPFQTILRKGILQSEGIFAELQRYTVREYFQRDTAR